MDYGPLSRKPKQKHEQRIILYIILNIYTYVIYIYDNNIIINYY